MLSKLTFLLSCLCSVFTATSQNWLTTGNSGLTTSNFFGTLDSKPIIFKANNTEYGRLLPNGVWRFGNSIDNLSVDLSGKLSFNGAGAYKVGDNRYVFQNTTFPNKGLFFNSTLSQYEFRNSSSIAMFFVNSDNGNTGIAGSLKIGAYILPNIDGTNGQVLSTNGNGVVSWKTNVIAGANTALSNLATTSVNQSLIPANDNVMDLGNKLKAWRNIYADGKVGIGLNTDPFARLDIRAAGTSANTASLRISNIGPFGIINTLFTVRDDGRVGIGTPNPAAALDVLGDAVFSTGSTDCDLRQKTSNTDMGWYASGSTNKLGLYNYAISKSLVNVLGTGEMSIGGDPAPAVELSLNIARNSKNLWNDLRFNTNQKFWQLSTYVYEDVTNDLFLMTKDGGGGWFDYFAGIYVPQVSTLNRPSEKISPLLERVNKLKPKMISYSQYNKEHKSYRFEIDDLTKTFPNTVYTSKNPQTGEIMYGINYDEFSVIAIKAIQEQQQQLNKIEQQNKELQEKNNELEQRLAKVEASINVQPSNTSSQLQQSIFLTKASLAQNIPNPFNHTTTIAYTLPSTFSKAKITVTDKSGKLIKGFSLSGSSNGTIQLDAATLAGATYNYSLFVDDKLVATRQMLVAK